MANPLAFTRAHRLLSPSQFQFVFDHARWKVGNSHFLLLAAPNDSAYARLGMVIGKKKVKRAVDRATIKRRTREQFRLRHTMLAGFDILLIPRARLDNPDPIAVTRELGQLFDKLLAKSGQA